MRQNQIGPAIITFKSKNNTFSITNSHHYFPDSLAQLSSKSKIISLDYKATDSLKTSLYPFANIDIPLFFLDVNFDGVDELIITKKGTGQRFWDTFDVYEIEDGEIKEPFYQITSKKPFVDFDIATKIDKMKKEITTYLSGGACDSSYKLYAFKNEKLQLVKQIERWLNENDICMQKEYSYKNGKRKKIYEGHFKADSLAIHPTGN